jgi:hypothetical protein
VVKCADIGNILLLLRSLTSSISFGNWLSSISRRLLLDVDIMGLNTISPGALGNNEF